MLGGCGHDTSTYQTGAACVDSHRERMVANWFMGLRPCPHGRDAQKSGLIQDALPERLCDRPVIRSAMPVSSVG